MKVLLISANTHAEPYPVYPLGLDYVAGSLAGRHEVSTLDMNVLREPDLLKPMLTDFDPDITGISIRNIDNTDTTNPKGFAGFYQDLTAVIRSVSRSLIVLGGSGFSIFPDQLLSLLDADAGIIGEGERLRGLVDRIETNPPGDPLKGVHTLKGVITRKFQHSAGSPNWVRYPVRRIPDASPAMDFYLSRGGMMNLQTKRGCSLNCIYCTYPGIEGSTIRRQNPETVAQTAIALERKGARYLFITDSVFNSDPAHSLAVVQAFRTTGLSIPWGGYFSPMKTSPDYYKKLADAGLTHVEFGTESLSDRVLAAYQKPFTRAQVLESHQAALEAGLFTAHFMLLGGPGETPATLEKTLECLTLLRKTVIFFYLGMRIYPGTGLYDLAVREGRLDPSADLLAPVFYQSQGISEAAIIERVTAEAQGRPNWVIGTGGETTARLLSAMYRRGRTGPLWEHLIR